MTSRDVTSHSDVVGPAGSHPAVPGTAGKTAGQDDRIDRFIRDELGPVSTRLLEDPARRQAVRARLQAGSPIHDAVLAEIHGTIHADPRLADEFAAYFLFDLMKMGKLSMTSTSRLRRFLDTGDLVLSVFGDLWGDLSSVGFESRDQFKSLFAQRMNWKAADKARGLQAKRRQENRRLPASPEDLDLTTEDPDAAPLPQAIREEERQRLILILLRLKDRDRKLLTHYLKGEPIESIASELGLSPDSTRKALSRAIRQARDLAAASERCCETRA